MARHIRCDRAAPLVIVLAFACSSETTSPNNGTSGTSQATSSTSGSTGTAGPGSAAATTGPATTSGAATSGTGTTAAGTGGAGTGGSSGTGGGAGIDASMPSDRDAQGDVSQGSGGTAGTGGSSGSADGGTGCKGANTLCWDFETGKTPTGWAPVVSSGTGSIAVDNTKAHGGTYSLHVKASGSNPMHSVGGTLPANFGGTMWGRAYMYLTPSGPPDHGATFKARYADAADMAPFGPEKLDWYETGLGHGTYETIWHMPQPPTGLPEWEMISKTPNALNQWFCEEWLFDAVNGTQPEAAEPRMWIDGTELAFPDKHIYPGGAVKPPFLKATNFILIEVGLIMYHPVTAATDLWIDDLALGPERIGCN